MNATPQTVYVVLVFDPEEGYFESIAGVYTSRSQAEKIRGDCYWYQVHEVQVDDVG